jgi:hypothetical protein
VTVRYRQERQRWYAPKLGFAVCEPLFINDYTWVVRLDFMWFTVFIDFLPETSIKYSRRIK